MSLSFGYVLEGVATTPAEPTVIPVWPSLKIPRPNIVVIPSPEPTATGIPCLSPVKRLISLVTVPAISVGFLVLQIVLKKNYKDI